jgi:hypothetical protein
MERSQTHSGLLVLFFCVESLFVKKQHRLTVNNIFKHLKIFALSDALRGPVRVPVLVV